MRASAFVRGWVAVVALTVSGCSSQKKDRSGDVRADEERYAYQENVEPYVPYVTRRARHVTKLRPAHVTAADRGTAPPRGAQLVWFRSPVGELRGWLAWPSRDPESGNAATSEQLPVVVALHNDFALRADAFENVRPFLDAGFALFMPSYRGEDGNPGERELLYGEVDDAKAAIAWIQANPRVRADCTYVIGHSIGGGIAALLALDPTVRVRATASVGGIYRAQTFHAWARQTGTQYLVRFDVSDSSEVALRLLAPNIRDLVHLHIAYAGEDDDFDVRYAQLTAREAERRGVPYRAHLVKGDHMTSMTPSVEHFRRFAAADRARCGEAKRRD